MSKHNCQYCECRDILEDNQEEISKLQELNNRYDKIISKFNDIVERHDIPLDVFDCQLKLYMENLSSIIESRCDRLQIIIKGVTDIYDQKFKILNENIEKLKSVNSAAR